MCSPVATRTSWFVIVAVAFTFTGCAGWAYRLDPKKAALERERYGATADQRIGDGLVGMNVRYSLQVPDGSGLPSSIIAKLPSPDPTSRATGISLRNYEREVKFYNEIQPTVDIRVPRCFHGEWHADDGDFVLLVTVRWQRQRGTGDTRSAVAVAMAVTHNKVRRWVVRRIGHIKPTSSLVNCLANMTSRSEVEMSRPRVAIAARGIYRREPDVRESEQWGQSPTTYMLHRRLLGH